METQFIKPNSLGEVAQKAIDAACKHMETNEDPTFQMSAFARKIFLLRYAMKDRDGNILEHTAAEAFLRVAKCIAAVDLVYKNVEVPQDGNQGKTVRMYLFKDKQYKVVEWLSDETKLFEFLKDVAAYYKLMHSRKFCPAGRSMVTWQNIVANCVVLHPQDSLFEEKKQVPDKYDIMTTLSHAAKLQSYGSGLGYPFHLLRPHNDTTTRGKSGGPVSFMLMYDTAAGVIKQNSRHGANMGVMSVDHPEILEFMRSKRLEDTIKNFNISVGITHEFMKQATSPEYFNKPWAASWKKGEVRRCPYYIVRNDDLIYNDQGTVIGNKLGEDAPLQKDEHYVPGWSAKQILEKIAEMAWSNGEPGVVFLDTVNDKNPLPGLGRIEACNPCVSKDTWIMTSEGPRQVCDLLDNPFKAVVDGKEYNSTSFFETGVKMLYEVCTEHGLKVKTTKNHRFSVKNTTKWIPLSKLNIGDEVDYIKYTNNKYKKNINHLCGKIVSITPLKEEMVYDCTVDVVHAFDGNGFKLHNCGEQFLHDGDVCNLGALNLAEFAQPGKPQLVELENGTRRMKKTFVLNENALRDATTTSTRFLDNVVDLSRFPLQRVKAMQRGNRRLGLGIMGFANLLYKLEIPYDSKAGRDVAERVMRCIHEAAFMESVRLGKIRGAFPNFEKSVFSKAYNGEGIPVRNAALTNIAPTGTTGSWFEVCNGCEPYFLLSYSYNPERVLNGMTESDKKKYLSAVKKSRKMCKEAISNKFASDMVVELRPELMSALKERKFEDEKLLTKLKMVGSARKCEELPEDIRDVFCTSMDITPKAHVLMQSAFQKYCDNAISKTVNLPHSATVEDVMEVYKLAHAKGCKGCTVYRDQSRVNQVITARIDSKTETPASATNSSLSCSVESSDSESLSRKVSSEVDLSTLSAPEFPSTIKLTESMRLNASEDGSPVCVRGGKCD